MVDNFNIANTLNSLQSALQQFIVAPMNAFGMGGFVFDIQDESMAVLQADITDHYTEDNKALQDHIAIKPRRITLRGYVGELVYQQPGSGSDSTLQQVTQKLTILDAFLPKLSDAAVQAQSIISGDTSPAISLETLTNALPVAANIYSLVKNTLGVIDSPTQRQQAAYQYFAGCQSAQILMGIQTPWEFLANMAVETITAIQPAESIFLTDFIVVFKQIRIADSLSLTVTPLSGTGGATVNPSGAINGQGAYAAQIAPQAKIGTIVGADASEVNLSNPLNNPLGAAFQYVIN